MHSMCLCVRKKVLVLIKVKFSVFVQTFTKRSLNYLVAVTQNFNSENWRAVSSFRNGAMFFSEIRVPFGCTTFSISFSCVMKLFFWKKQFNDRHLSNSFSVAVEEKFKKFLVFSLIQ